MTDQSLTVATLNDQILAKIRAALDEEGIDVLVATASENLAYVCGAVPPSSRTVRERLAAGIVPIEGDTELVTVDVEAGIVRGQTRSDRLTQYREFVERPIDVIAKSLVERGLGDGRIGVEIAHLPHADFERLSEALPSALLVPVDSALAELRTIKAPAEIDMIRRIGRVADDASTECVRQVAAGSTERDLGSAITEYYTENGGDQLTMLVVGAGERSAFPNAPPTKRRMLAGETVRLDVIGTSSYYYSDVARTAVVGEPSSEQQRVYDLLRSLHERAIEMLRPGAITSDIYEVYRSAMRDADLPYYHFLGHGLGVTLHEEPFINDLQSIPLRAGMVVCIEPLTMIEGKFGMQIEDEILITDDGCERFTQASDILRIGG